MDDDELLRRARELDEDALATIFDRYYRPLFGYIYHQVHHLETAEDLAAKVFQRLLEQLASGNGPTYHLKAWLFRVATNLVIDDSRRQQHRNHLPLDEAEVDTMSVEENVDVQLLAVDAQLALSQLTDQQRQVIILRYLVDLSTEEVAEILDLSVGAVKALQHRGMAALRRDLIHDVTADGEYHE